MKKGIKAFTLVELVVVITILAILATIWFVSFSWYLASTRDTNRISQLKSMSDALELYRTKKDLPIPDDKVDVKSWDEVIAYQWYIWKNVLETIEYTESGLDPKDKNYFSYYLTKNKKYFQLLAFLEEEDSDVVALNTFNESYATDYSDRYPKTIGKKLWILTDSNNTPIQELSNITWSWYLDTYSIWNLELKSFLNWEQYISWTWWIIWNEISKLLKIANIWWKYWIERKHKKFMHKLPCEEMSEENINNLNKAFADNSYQNSYYGDENWYNIKIEKYLTKNQWCSFTKLRLDSKWDFPMEIWYLSNLKDLEIYWNNNDIPLELFNLEKLNILYINFSDFNSKALSDDIEYISNLIEITIDYNEQLPYSFVNLKWLTEYNCWRCDGHSVWEIYDKDSSLECTDNVPNDWEKMCFKWNWTTIDIWIEDM